VHAEVPAIEQHVVGQARGIELDLHRLGVAGVAVMDLIVAGGGGIAADVADLGGDHAVDAAEQLLHAPEAAAGEDGDVVA
jgi:hypothetical protein